ncbi:DUF4254 domain-containing protein [Legionella taurinensis]|uniref:DUF4254 domain-containing protein n=1 Tax=Legionella taurinensis TaxID=70611 RepID=A0A3A5LCA1_9GAMM|nr:DUF4254 domain-containing protein [Legionella taurinensis]MDX1836303.1 DUF4254 domain-containing protein [Legionella taurinensis]PUT41942.1 hypothetical protein DB744_02275 [Legionella taurinensis]PUT44731.1 hypothetical protein DB746_02275 [Legionella taurinensis]PUT48051.1 hypothetical protein DB743_00435 [Legionella taurinensis]PUT48866.1 hypothetical protein DB745_02275 [Legionella taurinensis]
MSTLVESIKELHHHRIIDWKQQGITTHEEGFLGLVEQNHAFNYQLWHAEDRARREDMGFEFVYKAKREIDYCNQQRNDRMEAMDQWLYQQLEPQAPDACPVHSETPGMMIDRLSILALKAYHMQEQTERSDADESHRQTCQRKLLIIHAQQLQLLSCLTQLLDDVKNKQRTFRVYHQFKMYNDPSLNPEIYRHR